MWSVASHTTLGLHCGMFKSEWARFVCMAVEAEGVLGCRSAELVSEEPAVWIMTVGAAYQALVHAMVEGLGKIRLNLQMTAITKLRLRRSQELVFHFGIVDGVAVNAPNIIFQVVRTQEVGMLFAELMAAQTTLGGFLARQTGEADDLGRIGRFSVLFAGSMTRFASLPLRACVLGQIGLPVRPLV